MFNLVHWPISAILWFWHKVSGSLFGPSSGISWVLAIILLVVTIRIPLFKPMLNQQRSATKMQQLTPEMWTIKEKYKNDQQAQALAMRQLQKEMGVDPLGGCLPVLVQMPVLIGFFHVLRSFNRAGVSGNTLGMPVEQSQNTSNYTFGMDEMRSFLLARVLNAPLFSSTGMNEDQYAAFTVPGTPTGFTRMNTMTVAILLIVVTALVTHFNARMSVERMRVRQEVGLVKRQEGPMGQQMDMMSKMILWFFPIMILVTGAFWHIDLLVHMVANNMWAYFQQRYIFGKPNEGEKEAIAAKKAAKREARKRLAPKVGQRPINPKRGGKYQAVQNTQQMQSDQISVANKVSNRLPDGNSGEGQQGLASKPAPGQKPANWKDRKYRKKQLKQNRPSSTSVN